ncbi:sulfotransferase [Magnetococcus marinus MC-1]|uniref:Sulfotransferase n=1 Tax=Magnetococcus marinus (strain ATCC BAA-1437 / JCM 17883 / MC-1) TaxID=156889 RepID=A0LE13_MAGMM|nr:tetratricopeptide repeat-containing sulfotransferase family protein [Magnetococcus marinus]ABK46206.1 sulfotransferase [Magnetococcus marinus MC-1]
MPPLPLQQIQTHMDAQAWPQAWQLCQAQLQKNPDHGPLLTLAGEILIRTSHFKEAAALLQRALQQLPDSSTVYHLLGRVMLLLQEPVIAGRILHEGLSKDPEHAPLREALADLQSAQQTWSDAIRNYQLLLSTQPENPDLHRKLADALREHKDFHTAEIHYQQALALNDQSAASWHGLGQLELARQNGALAEQHFLKGRKFSNHPAAFDNSIGLARLEDGRVNEAIAAFKQGLEAEPHAAFIQINLANALRASGDFAATQALFEEGVAHHPEHPFFLTGLAQMVRQSDPHSELIQRMEQMVQHPDMVEQERIAMLYTLGRALDQSHAYDRAFTAYQQANRRRYQSQGLTDLHINIDLIARIRTLFNRPQATLVPNHSDGVVPLFIVGMFRSGSTLIEQILGSHPQVATTGERPHIANLLHQMPQRLGTTVVFPDCFSALKPDQAQPMAQEYLDALRSSCDAPNDPTITHITDKLLFNFLYLGVIAALFPHARIIHSVRDPRDTCLSIYFQNFTRGQRFMQSLEETAHYYRAYADLMRLWHRVLPMPIHDVVYEKMVEDPASEVKKLLEFVGLPWDDACMNHHQNRRSVQTASSQQVREPIYQHAKQRWKNYEKHLHGLQQILTEPQSPTLPNHPAAS